MRAEVDTRLRLQDHREHDRKGRVALQARSELLSLTIAQYFAAILCRSHRHERELGARLAPSATCPRESVLPIRLRPDFYVVFEGYAGWAEYRPRRQEAQRRSLGADILRTS
jgi:hypothetical protein